MPKKTGRLTYRGAEAKPKGGRKSASGPDGKSLVAMRDKNLEEYGKAKRTRDGYRGYIARGKKWVQDMVVEAEARGDTEFEGLKLEDLRVAFENPPNACSSTALELFIVQKCFTEGNGVSTAEGIHAAFARYWDTMEDQRFSGNYAYDRERDIVTGCPARAPGVGLVMQAIKTRAVAKGAAATRNHAEAMTIEDFSAIIHWSESICPNELFGSSVVPQSMDVLQVMNIHGLARAFFNTGFTLFTRNFETASLQVRDFTFNLSGPAPFYPPMFTVSLEERKGWQKMAGYDGPRTSNVYEIYPQVDIPEIDMHSHLLRWLTYLESRIGRPLEPDDYIFPNISRNGIIDAKSPISYDSVQSLIQDFAKNSGLTKVYTTHCFRRGGAQYRFMYAPLGTRWSLSLIRWWGGWAIGEHVDTLIKYLVNSLQAYETGYASALCPTFVEPGKYFMGDDQKLLPASKEELYRVKAAIDDHFEILRNDFKSLTLAPAALAPIHCQSYPPPIAPPHFAHSLPPPIYATHTSYPAPSALVYTPHHTFHHASAATGTALSSAYPTTALSSESAHTSRPSPAPIAGVVIPNLQHGAQGWKDAVAQWEKGVPGMPVPLKDWPSAWYTGAMREVTGTKRVSRKRIFDEFVRSGRDDSQFVADWPEALRGVSALLKAIRERRNLRRGGKSGDHQDGH